MPPSEQEVRTALEMLPQSVLRTIIEERDSNFTSQYTEELIDHLIDGGWTDEEYDSLMQRVVDVEHERSPKSRYIARVDGINPGLQGAGGTARAREVIERNAVEFVGNELADEGFQHISTSDGKVRGIHWTKSINYKLTPHREIRTEPTLYNTGFELNPGRGLLLIDSTLPPKARSLVSKLEENGIETSDIEYGSLPNEVANNRVQDFINAVDQELQSRDPQTTVNEEFDRPMVEVDLVKILMDDMNLKDVRIGGRTNIIHHPEVEDFIDDYDSMIVRLEGKFELGGKWYEFKAGQTDGMGQVSVRKQGSVEERPELVDESFDFLYGIFEQHFMDV